MNEVLPTETVQLLVSPRTVQSDLIPVYTKRGLISRGQLVHKAARHS